MSKHSTNTKLKPHAVKLLSQTNFLNFAAISVRGRNPSPLAQSFSIMYFKLRSGKIRVKLFLNDQNESHAYKKIKPRYTSLLSITDFLVFVSRSVNGLTSLTHYCEIVYFKSKSGKIRVKLFLKDQNEFCINKVRDIIKAGNFDRFKLENPGRRKKSK